MGKSPMATLDPLQIVQAHPAVAVALVFLLDGIGIPLMPEIAVLLAFSLHPTLGAGLGLLGIVVIMEVFASLLLYCMVRFIGMPSRIERLLAGYSKSLLLNDERLLLLNRVIPVLPMSGAFIHLRRWRLGRSFAFLALGSFAKYGLLLLVAGTARSYFQSGTALLVGFSLAGVFLAISWTVAIRRWWIERQLRREPALA